MKAYETLSKDELLQLHTQLVKEYEEAKGKGLKLDMSRCAWIHSGVPDGSRY